MKKIFFSLILLFLTLNFNSCTKPEHLKCINNHEGIYNGNISYDNTNIKLTKIKVQRTVLSNEMDIILSPRGDNTLTLNAKDDCTFTIYSKTIKLPNNEEKLKITGGNVIIVDNSITINIETSTGKKYIISLKR